MKMVAASKLRRAQERIMNARPYAQQMQRVLDSVASRVDPSIHPLLRVREPRPDSRTLVIVVTGDKGLCGSFNTNVIKAAGAASSPSSAAAVHARPGRPQGPRLLPPPRLRRCCSSRSASSRSCAYEDARRSRRRRSTRSSTGDGRSRDARLQRVQVGHDAARRRRPAAADRAGATSRPARRRAAGRRVAASTTSTSRRRRRSSTSCCRATSRCRSTARCSSRTPRSSPRR